MTANIYGELLTKTIEEVVMEDGNYALEFKFTDGTTAEWSHIQDCCENVEIEEIVGDLDDLVGSPLLQAEVVKNASEEEPTTNQYYSNYGSYTWTFYKFGTNKGSVTIRWLGQSNGYYSEEVSCFINGKYRD